MADMAVIKTGGKQYIVKPGTKLQIEKLSEEQGSTITFGEVLLIENEKGTQIGTPFIEGAQVKGKLIEHGKGKKLVIFKFKSKKREQTKKGHRQKFTEIEVTSIEEK